MAEFNYQDNRNLSNLTHNLDKFIVQETFRPSTKTHHFDKFQISRQFHIIYSNEN